jgi:hypothetical protein
MTSVPATTQSVLAVNDLMASAPEEPEEPEELEELVEPEELESDDEELQLASPRPTNVTDSATTASCAAGPTVRLHRWIRI